MKQGRDGLQVIGPMDVEVRFTLQASRRNKLVMELDRNHSVLSCGILHAINGGKATTMHKIPLTVTLIVLSTLLAGRATDGQFRLDPTGGDSIWYSGTQYEIRTKNGITAYAAFKYKWNGTLTFYVAIENMGPDTALVAPECFYTRDTYYRINVKRESEDFQPPFCEKDTTDASDTFYTSNPDRYIDEF